MSAPQDKFLAGFHEQTKLRCKGFHFKEKVEEHWARKLTGISGRLPGWKAKLELRKSSCWPRLFQLQLYRSSDTVWSAITATVQLSFLFLMLVNLAHICLNNDVLAGRAVGRQRPNYRPCSILATFFIFCCIIMFNNNLLIFPVVH